MCVGCWHLTKWCSLRLKVACVCVYLVLLYAFVGLAGGLGLAGGVGFAYIYSAIVGWWRRFCLYFLGVPSVRYATPEKQRFWSSLGSQLGGVLAKIGVVFFDAF